LDPKNVSSKNNLISKIDSEIAKCFDLTYSEYEEVLNETHADNKMKCLDYFLGHEIQKLSELDLKMIKSVPSGGNWQDIPTTIPSRRLDQIRRMSKERGIVRTSYYGRLRLDQPSYTVSTYFNRPGNGTNIHPIEDRTISLREAAALQSFPNEFLFFGTNSDIRNQIGNAVPPLLSFALAKCFKKETVVDLFCGAGGLSTGFISAGHNVIMAQELDQNAAKTYMFNHPKSEILVGDISDKKIQTALIEKTRKKLHGKRLGILIGGPPCQGFSTAGWRSKNDERSSLVKYFFEMVHTLNPKFVVIENVLGLMSMNDGKTLDSIIETFEQLDYSVNTEPWVLKSEQYGVPQMRRRLFFIASHKGETLPEPPLPIFDECMGRREFTKVNNSLLPYPITVEEAFDGFSPLIGTNELNSSNKTFSKFIRGELTFQEFVSYFKNSLDSARPIELK